MSDRSTRKFIAGLAAIPFLFAVGGCSESASHLEEREIVWPEGKPSGHLEDSEWGQVYRHVEIELSLARGYEDFSDPDLIATIGRDLAGRLAWATRTLDPDFENATQEQIGSYTSYASVGTIVEIDEQRATDSATVIACGGWDGGPDDARFGLYTWTFTRTSTGSIVATYRFTLDWERCVTVTPHPGLWAEPFDVGDFDHTTVKMPLPREHYVKLGVIDE